MFKLELHCHSSEVSACSHCPAETLIRRYKEAGYHGIVSTNHINRATFQRMESFSWHEKIDHFISCEKSSISFTAPFRLREPLRLGGSASAGLFLLKDTSFSDIMAVKG